MDFLTAFPYWGIIVIILINAWIVSRMKITVDQDDTDSPKKSADD